MTCRFAVCLAVAALVWSPPAHAEGEGRSVVVVVEGGDSEAVASQIAGHIEAPNAVRDARPFRAALAAHGTRALAPAVGNRARDAQLIARAHAAEADLHVDVAILIVNRKTRRGSQAHLWVIDAKADGAVVDKDLGAPTDEADAAWAASAALFPVVAAKEPPPKEAATAAPALPVAPASAPAATSEEAAGADHAQAAEPVNPGGGGDRTSALLVAQANLDAGSRHFSYVDRITPTLRPYDLFAAPVIGLTAEVYPLARMRIPVLNGLGVTGDYSRAIAIGSADAGGARVGTTWQSYDLGVRDRIVVSKVMLLGVNVGYGAIDFTFDKPSFAAALPSAGYRFVRAGVDLRASFGPTSIFGGASYLGVLGAGDMGGLFPREHVGGMEARVGGAYLVAKGFELSLSIGYTRFFYTMNPVPGDANVAGGALDEMAHLSLAFAYLL